ncbi:MAG: hypothetical protein IKZ96_01515 [Bacilli bacterium]|nr:hypothetical protein [Bacilli bacterium]
MSDFDTIKAVFEQKKEHGYTIGLTYNDSISIKKSLIKLYNLGLNDPKVKQLYDEMSEVYRILLRNGGTNKFSKANRDYIKEHALLLPLVLTDSKKLNIDIVKDRPILECRLRTVNSYDNFITINELDNRFVSGPVNHENIEELYPEVQNDSISYVGDKYNRGYNDSLEMLCRIYNFRLPNKKSKFHDSKIVELASKFVSRFNYDEITTVLDCERRILEENGFKEVDGKDLDSIFGPKKEIIERVYRGEFDPEFEYEEAERVLLFKK